MDLRIFPPEGIIESEVSLPLSKSMSNRALIMSALTIGGNNYDVAKCDDTVAMLTALKSGLKGEVNIGAAGTAMRFLTALYAALPGSEIVLDGTDRMRQRPIGPLVDALRECGAQIEYIGEEGFPPLRIYGKRLHGGTVKMDATVSSQFISALLMVAPTFTSELTLELKGEIASLPYLMMTIEMMRIRGIDIEKYGDTVTVKPGKYQSLEHSGIERDWSAASYWYSVAALSAGWITLKGLTLPSLQGDSEVAAIFEKLGVISSEEEGNIELSASPEVYSRLDLDFSDTPDLVQTVVVACVMLGIPFHFTGVQSLRIKETDRIEALCKEVLKLGAAIEVESNGIKWNGKKLPLFKIPEIDTYSDHRMAMAFAPVSLYIPGVIIRNCEVVGKSYPTFWKELLNVGFKLLDAKITAG